MTFILYDQGKSEEIIVTTEDLNSYKGDLSLTSSITLNDYLSSPDISKNPERKEIHRVGELDNISEIMASPVISIPVNQKLKTAIVLFKKHRFHHFPIVNEKGKITGILSDRDIIASEKRLVPGGKISEMKVSDVMSKYVLATKKEVGIRIVAAIMCKNRISALPVVNNEHEIEGIVTSNDLLRAIINFPPIELI